MRSFVLWSTFTARKDGSFFIVFFTSWISEHTKDLSGLHQRSLTVVISLVIEVLLALISPQSEWWDEQWCDQWERISWKDANVFFWQMKKSQSIRTRHFLTEKEQNSMTEIDFSAIKKPTITSRGVFWYLKSSPKICARKKTSKTERSPTETPWRRWVRVHWRFQSWLHLWG